jgi:hypothetical protein
MNYLQIFNKKTNLFECLLAVLSLDRKLGGEDVAKLGTIT